MSEWKPDVEGWRRRELDPYETWAKDFYEWLDDVKAFVWDEGWNVGRESEWADEVTDNPYRGESA